MKNETKYTYSWACAKLNMDEARDPQINAKFASTRMNQFASNCPLSYKAAAQIIIRNAN
jgi:hypothetical protein